MSNDELKDIREFFQENQEKYSKITYIELDDKQAQLIDLEEKFVEYEGSKEKLLNYDKHTNKLLTTNEQYNQFALNTFKKIIKTKLNQLDNFLKNADNQLVKRKEIEQLKEEIAKWTAKYEYAVQLMNVEITYRNYTVEEVDFSNKNAIIFLRGESGKTLYEEGLITNGDNQAGIISPLTCNNLKLMMQLLVNNTIELKSNSYGRMVDDVERKRPNGSWEKVIINGKKLKRASINSSQARIGLIRLNVAQENKLKLGIPSNQGIILVLGTFEIKMSNHEAAYNDISTQARHYEEQIQKIMAIFENPNTPREVLLQYLADSYGLVEKLIEEPSQPSFSDGHKRGGM